MSFSRSVFEKRENDSMIDTSLYENLIQENQMLKNQLSILIREKEAYAEEQGKEKECLKLNLRQMQERLVYERNNFRSDITELTKQLELLKESVIKMTEIRDSFSKKNCDVENSRNERKTDKYLKIQSKK